MRQATAERLPSASPHRRTRARRHLHGLRGIPRPSKRGDLFLELLHLELEYDDSLSVESSLDQEVGEGLVGAAEPCFEKAVSVFWRHVIKVVRTVGKWHGRRGGGDGGAR
jgi:hypothetical protein